MSSTTADLHADLGACQKNTADALKLIALLTHGKSKPQLLYPAFCITPAKHEP